MNIDPTSEVIGLIKLISEEHPVDGHEKGDLTARVKEVSALLRDNEGLMRNSGLMGQIWTFTENNNDPAVQKLRRELLFNSSCNIETLTLSTNELEKLGDELWGMIETHGVEKLVIQLEGEPIEYGARVLKQFMKMDEKPPVEDLTEFYTLQFEDGQVKETKANLLLCGEYIQTLLGQKFIETQTHRIDFTKSRLTPDVFNDILQEVKACKREMEFKDYRIVCRRLQYSKWTGFPEGAIGPDQWERVGFKVKEVPPLPNDIDEILKSDCPYFMGKKVHQTHKLILIPAKLSINKLGSLMRHLRRGNYKTVFQYIWYKITNKLGGKEVEKSYWALVTTDVIPKSLNKSFEEQEGLIKEGYEVPSALDAIALATIARKYSKWKEGNLPPEKPGTFTRCMESMDCWQLVVSAIDNSGLTVSTDRYTYKDIGVLALRKFC